MSEFAHASVRGLIEDDGAYLLLRHDMPSGPIWGAPGGRAEVGERPRDAVAREVREETSLEVAVGDPLEAYPVTWAGGEEGTVSVVFDCDLLGGTVDVESNPHPEEPIDDYAWVEPAAAAELPMNERLRALLRRR
ncbi:NUDIX domain-containing protein [Salinilacihabitans rarus]|uniref:NUDIX domain-containing protein n=1 Tax=Salinilacihabitans rarus TaxID=2961596 RepID=UPI0020C89365|nr:NUDIX hydrolase [Salinilacihabitans rarus]